MGTTTVDNTRRRSHWPLVLLSAFSSILGLLLPLVLVRVLSPQEVGHFKIFFLYLTILPTFSLTSGLMSGLAYWSGQADKSGRALRASSTLLALLAFIFASTTFLFREQISRSFGWSNFESSLFALALFGAIAASFFEEAAIATGRIWTGALFYSGFEIFRISIILSSLFYFKSLSAVLMAHTAVITLKVLVGFILGYFKGVVGLVANADSAKEVWRYAFPVSLAWVFGIFVSSADQFILSFSISPANFALYSIGSLSIAPLLIFEHAVTRVLIPQMSESFAQKNSIRASELYRGAVENLAFILIPAVAGLTVFAVPIIELIFTKTYSAASQYLQIYAFTYLLLIIPYDALPRARGNSNWILKTFVIFSFVSLTLAFLFSRAWGPVGALCAVLASGFSMRVYALIYFKRETGNSLNTFLPLHLFAHYMILCIALSSVALSVQPFFSDLREWFFVAGSLFAIVYFIVALPLKNRSSRAHTPGSRVLIVAQSLNIGGLEQMVLHLCDWLRQEQRWEVRLLCYDQTPGTSNLISKFEEKGISVEAFKKRRGFSPLVVYKILRSIHRNDIHVLHSHDLGGLVYAVCAKICSFGQVSVVHTQHSFIHLERKARYAFYEKLFTYFVDRLSVVSEDTLETYRKMGFKEEKITVIQNGVDFLSNPLLKHSERVLLRKDLLLQCPKEQQERLSGYESDHWILYLARFFPGKGQDRALKVWQHLRPDIRQKSVLCFVGPESHPDQFAQISALIKQAPDNERVFLLGGSKEPKSWLQASDMYLSCSEFEGMPLAPLEAAGAGLPTLLSNIAGHKFLGNISFLYPLGQELTAAEEIAEIFDRISKEDERYFLELWNRSRVIKEQFSIEKMSRKYSTLYSESRAVPSSLFSFLQVPVG